MGFFGGKKTYVSSTLYNMAGDIENRSNYLKTLVAGNVLAGRGVPMGEALRNGYLNGPGLKLRNFANWAKTNYEEVGMPEGNFASSTSASNAIVAAQLNFGPNTSTQVHRVDIGPADFTYWAEQWMFANRELDFYKDWSADYNASTGIVTVTIEGNSNYSFYLGPLDKTGTYIYASYTRTDNREDGTAYQYKRSTFIYKVGQGNATLDALANAPKVDDGSYFPFIPVRLNNQFLSDTYLPEAYEASVKAYRRATNASFDSLVDSLKTNENLKDIDYAYVMFGVVLNTKENSGRKYLFDFFKRAKGITGSGKAQFDSWKNYTSGGSIPQAQVRVKSQGSVPSNLDIRISWTTLEEASGTGIRKTGANPGDCWIAYNGTENYGSGLGDGYALNKITIYHQASADKWEAVTITGLVHRNYIYNGKYVEITAKEALEDPEESGFLVPLHYATYKAMSLVNSTQLSTACAYMVINSYKVVKTKWYQTGFFKVLLIVAIIAVTYATGGAGAFATGLLGSSAAIGAAVGLTGALAFIAGAVANALAAIILTKIIAIGATAIFGEKLGLIIAAVASIAAMQVGTALSNGTALSASFANLMSAPSIIQMTSAVGQGVSGWIQADAMSTMQKTQDLVASYEKKSAEISKAAEENLGFGRAQLDPLALFANRTLSVESPNTFLQRTLMTGTDIAELTNSLLTNFADITLSTELPL